MRHGTGQPAHVQSVFYTQPLAEDSRDVNQRLGFPISTGWRESMPKDANYGREEGGRYNPRRCNAEGDCVADTGSALETHIRRRAACKALSAFGKIRGVPACHSWNAP